MRFCKTKQNGKVDVSVSKGTQSSTNGSVAAWPENDTVQ